MPRRGVGFDRWDALVLVVYAAVLCWTIPHHEQWFDESQAWLIARDSSLREMLLHRLHYEGSPPLWHLLLWAMTRLHVPFAAFDWVGAGFAFVGIAVFLRYAKLPRIFRVLIPFTFFFQYQYAVIARSYVLFPLFAFTLCVLYEEERERPVLFGVVAGIFANLNVHALLFSGCMLLLYGWKLYRNPAPGPSHRRTAFLKGALAFSLCAVFAVLVAFPAPDLNFAVQSKIDKSGVQRLLSKLMPPEKLPPGAPHLDPILPMPPQVMPPMNDFERSIWNLTHDYSGSHTKQSIVRKIVTFGSLVDFPVSSSNVLALTFMILLGLWLWSRRSLPLLLPYVVLLCFETLVWTWVHQTGLLLIALIAAAWLASRRPRVRGPRWIGPACAVVSAIVILFQIGWTIFAVHYDTFQLYDPGRATHDYLVSHMAGKRIAGFSYETLNVEPYSDHSLFVNQPRSFWIWSSTVNINQRRTEGIGLHPDVILAGDEDLGNETIPNQWMTLLPAHEHLDESSLQFWRDQGFHETRRFCGARPVRFGFANTTCDVIFERNQQVSNLGH